MIPYVWCGWVVRIVIGKGARGTSDQSYSLACWLHECDQFVKTRAVLKIFITFGAILQQTQFKKHICIQKTSCFTNSQIFSYHTYYHSLKLHWNISFKMALWVFFCWFKSLETFSYDKFFKPHTTSNYFLSLYLMKAEAFL